MSKALCSSLIWVAVWLNFSQVPGVTSVNVTDDVTGMEGMTSESRETSTESVRYNTTMTLLETISTWRYSDVNYTDVSNVTELTKSSTPGDKPPVTANPNPPPCHILKEFGSENFQIKYTRDYIINLMCECGMACLKGVSTLSPYNAERRWFMSTTNQPGFFSLTTVLFIIFAVGIIGNALTIACLTCWVKKQSSTYLFILSLACSDLLLIVLCLPIKEIELFNLLQDILAGPACYMTYYLRDFSLASSVLTLTVISFERFYAICYPLKAQYRCNTRRARLLIVFIWVMAGCLCIPTIFVMKSVMNTFIGAMVCIQMTDDFRFVQAYYIYLLLLLYVLPLGVMFYTYSMSCLALINSARSAKKMQGDGDRKNGASNGKEASTDSTTGSSGKGAEKKGDEKGEGSIKARLKVIQMLIGMLVVFILCWGPMLFYQVLKSFGIRPKTYEEYWRFAVQAIAFSNSSMNPYFFMGMSSQFRREFRRRFGWLVGKGPVQGETTVATSGTMSSGISSSVYTTQASGKARI